ncbi:MAG: CDP-alcohol phosphatidyltransferase family protein [Promethearchaeota archaeon]
MAREKPLFTFSELKSKDLVTLIGTACGIVAIVLAIDGRALRFACFLIYLGGVFDLLDGWVARRWNQKNEIGTEIDSLSDVIVFAVAPAFIVYRALQLHFEQNTFPVVAYVLLVLAVIYFITCGVIRLAWFNITSDFEGYVGLVVPGSAVYLMAYYQVIYLYTVADFAIQPVADSLAWAFIPFIFYVGTLNVSHFLVYGKVVKRKVGVVKKLIFLGAAIGGTVVTLGVLFMDQVFLFIFAFCVWFLLAITGWVIYGIKNYFILQKTGELPTRSERAERQKSRPLE